MPVPTMSEKLDSTSTDDAQPSDRQALEPLSSYTTEELEALGEAYARKYDLGDAEDIAAFRKGAVCAQSLERYRKYAALTEEERRILESEMNHKWHQPKLLFKVIMLCSICAAVQGMDETVVNGAQLFYGKQFGIGDPISSRETWLLGLTNAAPYLCCAFLGSWVTIPANHYLGRRGTIFAACVVSALACLWSAFTNSWWHLFIARFFLGFGIGPNSATVPMYTAETAPARIRGALTMQWQVWTAFGIMLGYASDLAFYKVRDMAGVTGLNWRLMLGSAMIPAILVLLLVYSVPESPRWYMSKRKHKKAYQSLVRLRFSKIQAARDLFLMHTSFEADAAINTSKDRRNMFVELYRTPRNRRALLASEIVMFMQQFCGINVIAYYSSAIFVQAHFSEVSALAASLGFGVINFLFALPAIHTIDTYGRRTLLLITFPSMAICLFFTGFSFFIPDDTMHTARIACIALGIYLFGVVYSPGAGPVPFTYSAEAYPLYVRSYGMSVATATTWFFNFVLAVTWPSLNRAFKDQGAFAFYAVWNVIGFILVLLFVPETKGLTLEQLDRVFNVSTRKHAGYGLRQVPFFFKRYILGRTVEPEQLRAENNDEPGSSNKAIDTEHAEGA